MAVRRVLIFVAFAALAIASEVDDGEQKKRGAGKTTSLNAIPTGAQKPEYTYSIYSQSPNQQSSPPSPSYQSQPVTSSFYPNQASQYYTSDNSQADTQPYSAQPQLNFVPQQTQSQFVPLNFIPNPGYQPKIHIIPSKTANGNIQLAIIQQPTAFQPSASIVPYSHPLFSPNAGQVSPQHHLFNSVPQQYNIAPNYQPLQLSNPYLGQQSTYLFAQPNPSLYNNNLVYQNPVQSLYNYYPSQSQAKYSLGYGSPASNEYDKGPGPIISHGIPKDDNDVAHSNEYNITPADSSSYKIPYSSSRGSSYSKL